MALTNLFCFASSFFQLLCLYKRALLASEFECCEVVQTGTNLTKLHSAGTQFIQICRPVLQRKLQFESETGVSSTDSSSLASQPLESRHFCFLYSVFFDQQKCFSTIFELGRTVFFEAQTSRTTIKFQQISTNFKKFSTILLEADEVFFKFF